MGSTPSESFKARLLSRENLITNTAGIAPGYLQANLLALPAAYASDFYDLCLRNPVACPLLGVTVQGNPNVVQPAGCIQSEDFDMRTDFPLYRVYQHGKQVESRNEVLNGWSLDHVGFLIGCSFSFEEALRSAGLTPRHHVTGSMVPMYRSHLPLLPAGVFTDCKCVVSMRPYLPEEIERACGVTPQVAVQEMGTTIDGLVFAHEPGHMLVTDWLVTDLPRLLPGTIWNGTSSII
ncbi:hypothetical protein N7460_014087 [Penicillium canescens]|uniref:DUF1445 domain-containing protein n=1 Tax=Penicillium canescens TaxID=5083 RepID=A0AAD6N221_PENCN|nr:hypothetical protein N7460_014087 [Penicillium canescens]KAJ6066228.1 hypothetical protein N7444_000220 [Penicillium canescens]